MKRSGYKLLILMICATAIWDENGTRQAVVAGSGTHTGIHPLSSERQDDDRRSSLMTDRIPADQARKSTHSQTGEDAHPTPVSFWR